MQFDKGETASAACAGCRLKPQAEVDNANRGLNNSRYPAKTELNNYFIIHMNYYQDNDLITTKKSNRANQNN